MDITQTDVQGKPSVRVFNFSHGTGLLQKFLDYLLKRVKYKELYSQKPPEHIVCLLFENVTHNFLINKKLYYIENRSVALLLIVMLWEITYKNTFYSFEAKKRN